MASIHLSSCKPGADALLESIKTYGRNTEHAYENLKAAGANHAEALHTIFFENAGRLKHYIPSDYIAFCEANDLFLSDERDLFGPHEFSSDELPALTAIRERNMCRFRIYHDVVRLRRIAQKVLAGAEADEEGFVSSLPPTVTAIFNKITEITDRNYLLKKSIKQLDSDIKERRAWIKDLEAAYSISY